MEGLARAGNGTAEFVKAGERLQPKVGSNVVVRCSLKCNCVVVDVQGEILMPFMTIV